MIKFLIPKQRFRSDDVNGESDARIEGHYVRNWETLDEHATVLGLQTMNEYKC